MMRGIQKYERGNCPCSLKIVEKIEDGYQIKCMQCGEVER